MCETLYSFPAVGPVSFSQSFLKFGLCFPVQDALSSQTIEDHIYRFDLELEWKSHSLAFICTNSILVCCSSGMLFSRFKFSFHLDKLGGVRQAV